MSSLCLVCNSRIVPINTWSNLLTGPKVKALCKSCQQQLEKIDSARCTLCSRKMEEKSICSDCVKWQENATWKDVLQENRALYVYNDFLKKIIAQYKYRGDYALVKCFVNDAITRWEKERGRKFDYYVPIPLSAERLYERGFNQAEALLIEMGLPVTSFLNRKHAEKQSKKAKKARHETNPGFSLISEEPLIGRSILLIDDIYTTGSTIRYAAKKLKESGAESICSLTIAR
jgi:competence protein ComFC